MAMAMASLSLSSSSSPNPPSLFSSFSSPFTHLCRHCPFKSLSPTPSSPSVRQPLLRIVAKQPTRRETVKTRHLRIRKKLSGTPEKPRLAVFRSNKHLYAQVIDDTKGCTLASASTLEKERREELQLSSGATIEAAKRVGTAIAKACLDKGITKVAYDRGGFVYHGRIQALADAARETGLAF